MEYYTGRRVNVRALIYKNGKLLAVKHKHGEDISHYYAVPGGGLDPHESLVDGLARELREETGINAVIGNLLFIQQFPSAHAGYAEELEFFFTVKNPDDFTNIDLETTSHGAEELAVCEFVDPASVTLYPEFLQSIDLVDYINNDRPALVIDNLHEIHKN